MEAVIKSIGLQSFIAGIAAGYGDILQRFRQDCAALLIVLRTEGIADGVIFAVGAVAGKGNRELYKARAVFQRTEFNLINKVGYHKLGHRGILNACDLHSAVAVGRVSKGSKVGFGECRLAGNADGYRSKCSILCNSSSADAEVKGFCVGCGLCRALYCRTQIGTLLVGRQRRVGIAAFAVEGAGDISRRCKAQFRNHIHIGVVCHRDSRLIVRPAAVLAAYVGVRAEIPFLFALGVLEGHFLPADIHRYDFTGRGDGIFARHVDRAAAAAVFCRTDRCRERKHHKCDKQNRE